jgi:hypothetical protein
MVEEVIELEGSEASGLAVSSDAVWAVTYQTATLRVSTPPPMKSSCLGI